MSTDTEIPESIRRIQAMQIEPEEIIFVIEHMAREHEERPGKVDFYTQVAFLAHKYRGQPGRPFCISERMRCLTDLMYDERMRGWSIQGSGEGCQFTSEAVFRAVAKCPLRADSKQIWFDPDEFFEIALSETDAEGRA